MMTILWPIKIVLLVLIRYFPKIGKYVTMRPGSKIIGNSKIGNNCDIGINAVVLDQNIKINSIYLGEPKKFQLKLNKKENIILIKIYLRKKFNLFKQE